MSIGRRALIESVIGGLLLALLLTLTKEISFVQALTEPVSALRINTVSYSCGEMWRIDNPLLLCYSLANVLV